MPLPFRVTRSRTKIHGARRKQVKTIVVIVLMTDRTTILSVLKALLREVITLYEHLREVNSIVQEKCFEFYLF